MLSILGTSIPAVCSFYINFILTNGLTVKPIAFLRVAGYVILWVVDKLGGGPKVV